MVSKKILLFASVVAIGSTTLTGKAIAKERIEVLPSTITTDNTDNNQQLDSKINSMNLNLTKNYVGTSDYSDIRDIPNWDVYGIPYNSSSAMYIDLAEPSLASDVVNGKTRNTVMDALARCIYGECDLSKTALKDTDGERGRYAIARIIMNRKDSGDRSFGNSDCTFNYVNIIFSTNYGIQFEAMHVDKNPNGTIAAALQPKRDSAAWKQALRIAYNIVSGGRKYISNPMANQNNLYFLAKRSATASFLQNTEGEELIGGNYFFNRKW